MSIRTPSSMGSFKTPDNTRGARRNGSNKHQTPRIGKRSMPSPSTVSILSMISRPSFPTSHSVQNEPAPFAPFPFAPFPFGVRLLAAAFLQLAPMPAAPPKTQSASRLAQLPPREASFASHHKAAASYRTPQFSQSKPVFPQQRRLLGAHQKFPASSRWSIGSGQKLEGSTSATTKRPRSGDLAKGRLGFPLKIFLGNRAPAVLELLP